MSVFGRHTSCSTEALPRSVSVYRYSKLACSLGRESVAESDARSQRCLIRGGLTCFFFPSHTQLAAPSSAVLLVSR